MLEIQSNIVSKGWNINLNKHNAMEINVIKQNVSIMKNITEIYIFTFQIACS